MQPLSLSLSLSLSLFHWADYALCVATGVLSAPVSWDYLGQKLPLEFRAGFVGAEQRPDGTVAPAIGWYIQHT